MIVMILREERESDGIACQIDPQLATQAFLFSLIYFTSTSSRSRSAFPACPNGVTVPRSEPPNLLWGACDMYGRVFCASS